MELPTYTNIWRIEKRLYKLYDFRLPMPLPVGQIAVFTAIAVPYIIILTLLGLPFSHTSFWLYVLPPGVLAWLATRPVLESKRLPELIVSQLRYLGEPRSWCRLAPLAEKDEILVVARVWRRAEEPPPELAAQRQLKPARRGALASPEPALSPAALVSPEPVSPEPVSSRRPRWPQPVPNRRPRTAERPFRPGPRWPSGGPAARSRSGRRRPGPASRPSGRPAARRPCSPARCRQRRTASRPPPGTRPPPAAALDRRGPAPARPAPPAAPAAASARPALPAAPASASARLGSVRLLRPRPPRLRLRGLGPALPGGLRRPRPAPRPQLPRQ